MCKTRDQTRRSVKNFGGVQAEVQPDFAKKILKESYVVVWYNFDDVI